MLVCTQHGFKILPILLLFIFAVISNQPCILILHIWFLFIFEALKSVSTSL